MSRDPMIQPMPGRVLVQVIPVDRQEHMGPSLRRLGLQAVDKKKHFDHKTMQGRVIAVGRGVFQVRPGDVVIFEGVDGFTTDQDVSELENPLLGESLRWLKEKDCLCLVEETHDQEVPANGCLQSV